jgi:hypothetical protein
MAKYRVVEVTPAELGKERAETMAAMVKNLKKEGLSDSLIESIAAKFAGAASSNADGCFGMENPSEILGRLKSVEK